jgi:hypothetical protein
MKKQSIKMRLWGSLAHVPIVTIIWASYVIYRNMSQAGNFLSLFQFNLVNSHSLPITPIILTLCSIPISLSIMYAKKKSHFIYDNAQQAYRFNIWLLKTYSILFVGLLIGNVVPIKPLVFTCGIVATLIALLCFQQSLQGIITALRGNVFHYWYPFKKNN